MRGRDIGIYGMDHQGEAAGKPLMTFDLQLRPHSIGDHSPDYRGIDPSFFKYISSGEDPGLSSPSSFPLPFVQNKSSLTIQIFEGAADLFLQVMNKMYPLIPE